MESTLSVEAVNLFAGEAEATDAERLQALANVSNQEAGYVDSTPPVFTGKMGYVVLQPEKAGDAATTFASQIANLTNTIFEIRDVYDLGSVEGEEPITVTIPSGCTLKFNGGVIKNGIVTGDNTLIDETKQKIFDTSTILSGTWANTEIYPEWFGAVHYNESDPVSSVDAFRAVNASMPLCKIFTVKLNSIYYIDDEVEFVNPNGKTIVNIIGTGKETSGFYYHIAGESKYALKISQGSTYGVNNSVYRDFFIQSKNNPNDQSIVSTTKGVFYLENHIGSTCENIRIYGCRVSEGAFVMAVTQGNIFNNRFVDCQATQIMKAYNSGGHGLKYSVTYTDSSHHSWFPIMQTIVNCRFHSCQGAGIVTDILPINAGGFSGVIENCDTEGCQEGAMFFGGIINLSVINGYFEGYQQRSVDGVSPLSPFTFGLLQRGENENFSKTNITECLSIDGINVGHVIPTGEQEPHNVDYAVYIGNDTNPSGSVANSLVINGVNATDCVSNLIYLPMTVGKCEIGISGQYLDESNVKFVKGAKSINLVTITKSVNVAKIIESRIISITKSGELQNVGVFADKPEPRHVYKGYEYLCTDYGGIKITWDGTRYIGNDGFSASPIRGVSDNRPSSRFKTISGVNLPANTQGKKLFVGFTYQKTSGDDAGFYVITNIAADGTITWGDESVLFVGKTSEEISSIQSAVKRSGTIGQRPTAQYVYENLYEGYAYRNDSINVFEKAYATKIGDTYYVDWVPVVYPFPILFNASGNIFIDQGFKYYDTTLNKLIFASAINENSASITWVDVDGTTV